MLVAISIPIFNSQLEKSREATDEANLRSAYAECSAAVLSGTVQTKSEANGNVTIVENEGKYTATKEVTLKQHQEGWQSSGTGSVEIGGVSVSRKKLLQ